MVHWGRGGERSLKEACRVLLREFLQQTLFAGHTEGIVIVYCYCKARPRYHPKGQYAIQRDLPLLVSCWTVSYSNYDTVMLCGS